MGSLVPTTPESLRTFSLTKILELTDTIDIGRNPLPQEIGQLILSAMRDYILINDMEPSRCTNILKSFTRQCTPLTELVFSGLPINADLFVRFINNYHDIVKQINITDCPELRQIKLEVFRHNLDRCSKTLHTLIAGDTLSGMMCTEPTSGPIETTAELRILPELKLKTLIIHEVRQRVTIEDDIRLTPCLESVLRPSMYESLTYLDLSCSLVGDGRVFKKFKNLNTLILFNCDLNYPRIISNICDLVSLVTLDLSREFQESSEFGSGETNETDPKYLNDLVTKLPNLMSLDISCTSLVDRKDRHISVLETRKDRPFKFIGLFHTTNATFGVGSLPAKIIASEANETHILNALQAYIDRPRQLITALGDLFNLYKTTSHQDNFDNVPQAMNLVLKILTRHLTQQQVIVTGSAVLWYIIKINMILKMNYNTRAIRKVITRLLDAMHHHKDVEAVLINGGLILLLLPDLVFEYYRVAYIALHMCQEDSTRLKNFGATLMNHLACQVSGEQKLHIGKLGAIEIMMQIIDMKIRENISDETLESAWCTLWNITDETIDNCRTFLDSNGIAAFKKCMDCFTNNKDLLKNMMGLLGNVAECEELRSQFMEPDILNRFYELLSSPVDSIECSYNACGILAHIMSDGEEFWNSRLKSALSRKTFLNQMKTVIDSWPINSKRNINYRSFEPIVRLLQPHVPGEAKYWALFALANLTRVDPAKYCSMLLPHKGLEYLRQIADEVYPTEDYALNLARVTVYQYQKFVTDDTLSGLEYCDSIDIDEVKNFRLNEMEINEC